MASVKKLETFEDLMEVLDPIVREQQKFADRFTSPQDKAKFASEMVRVFGFNSLFYAEVYPDNQLKFCAVVELSGDGRAFWHFLFSHPRFRYNTKKVIEEIKDELRRLEVTRVYAKTERLTPSYKRWLNSIKFYPVEITYKCEL